MCFTLEITAAMTALCFGTGLLLTLRGRPWTQTQLFYVFSIMEFLQLLQYTVVDDCGSLLNRATTLLSYVHLCFQPVSTCLYAFRVEPNRDLTKFVLSLSAFSGALALLRLPYLGIGRLPASLRAALPGLPDVALAGSPAVCAWEWVCGPRTCTTRGRLHLQWELPLLPPSYYTPSGFHHFIFLFGPLLFAPGQFSRHRVVLAALLAATGPLLSQALAHRVTGEPGWRLEWPGVWCLFSAVQCVMAVTYELLNGLSDAKFTPGSPQYAQYLDAVRAGKLWSLLPRDWAAAGDVALVTKGGAQNGAAHANGTANGVKKDE